MFATRKLWLKFAAGAYDIFGRPYIYIHVLVVFITTEILLFVFRLEN